MGTIVLIIALVAEAAFVTTCLVTRSGQPKVKSWLRIGALAAFVLLALVSIIRWDFRWFLLTLLLVVWGILGARALLNKKAEPKPFSAWRTVGSAILTLLLMFITTVPALIFPQFDYPPVTGNHPIATANFTYTDDSRVETFSDTGAHREVNVEFWYPADGGGPYPLVIFSHGTFATKTSNASTFMELASHGYVVCSVDHPYHAAITVDADGRQTMGDRAYLQEFLDVNNGKYDAETTYKIEEKWLSLRTADLNFVVDTILARAKDSGSEEVYRLIDPAKIGLMGHSLGGAASAQVARKRSDIGAVVNLDADLLGEYVDFAGGKEVLNSAPYPVPILTIYADDMVRLMAAIPDVDEVVAVKHVSATAPHAYEVHLTGTNHLSLTDLPLASPFLVSLINASVPKAGGQETDPHGTIVKMNAIVLQFFDATLKGEGSFSTSGIN